jgi:hypothetical protein
MISKTAVENMYWKVVFLCMFFAMLCCAPCLEIIIQLFLLAEARIWITVPEKKINF